MITTITTINIIRTIPQSYSHSVLIFRPYISSGLSTSSK